MKESFIKRMQSPRSGNRLTSMSITSLDKGEPILHLLRLAFCFVFFLLKSSYYSRPCVKSLQIESSGCVSILTNESRLDSCNTVRYKNTHKNRVLKGRQWAQHKHLIPFSRH